MDTSDIKQLIDLVAADQRVEVEVGLAAGRTDTLVVWVNVDGICRLRVQGVAPGNFSARIQSGLTVRRPRG